MTDLFSLARNARTYDLAQPLYAGVPHFPTHPPFAFSLTKQHGQFVMLVPRNVAVSGSGTAPEIPLPRPRPTDIMADATPTASLGAPLPKPRP